MSGGLEQEYFSDGITQNIITNLSKISELFVISRNSSFLYKGKQVKIQYVAKDLGVRYVLEGSGPESFFVAKTKISLEEDIFNLFLQKIFFKEG